MIIFWVVMIAIMFTVMVGMTRLMAAVAQTFFMVVSGMIHLFLVRMTLEEIIFMGKKVMIRLFHQETPFYMEEKEMITLL
jgi:hypothetical protein